MYEMYIPTYALRPRAVGLRVKGIYVYQANHECTCYNEYVSLLQYRLAIILLLNLKTMMK